MLLSAWAHRLDASLGAIEARGSPEADALEAIGVAAAAAARRLDPGPLWEFVAGASGGLLVSNRSCRLTSILGKKIPLRFPPEEVNAAGTRSAGRARPTMARGPRVRGTRRR